MIGAQRYIQITEYMHGTLQEDEGDLSGVVLSSLPEENLLQESSAVLEGVFALFYVRIFCSVQQWHWEHVHPYFSD